ncbi:hypothetical protein [Streptomyces calidiresistens]|nr:hypothetical protein [Streptomyces calidiresistens]
MLEYLRKAADDLHHSREERVAFVAATASSKDTASLWPPTCTTTSAAE